jgi:cellobiose phosphorylase
MVREATDAEQAKAALLQIKQQWNDYLMHCQVQTPDPDMNTMLNTWHTYQCKTTFDWSRFISYYERGIVRGWGFRDSMQDVLGVMHAQPDKAKERIKTLLRIQASDGNARSVYFPATGESEGGGRSDDHLWSVFSVCTYLRESGDYAFLKESVPWVDGGEATVEEHLLRGLQFTRDHVGAHGIPKFLKSDWNDSICLIGKGGKAESAFVFFQAAHAAYELKKLYAHIGDTERYAFAEEYYAWCRSVYPTLWDGRWFLRAYLDNGEKFGTDEDEWNKLFLNPQSWAVLSRLATEEEGNSAFDEVYRRLFCEFGLISHAPASSKYHPEKKSFLAFPCGIKENGGVFCHANTWAVIAETLLGRNNEAYRIYRASLPSRRNDKADQTLIEPYVYASAMLGPAHERFGAGSNSWLTGTASWMYLAATQYILGFRPDYDGIVIDPHIPEDWDGFTMQRDYRGTRCSLKVGKLPYEKARVKALRIDGERREGCFIPATALAGKSAVTIETIF